MSKRRLVAFFLIIAAVFTVVSSSAYASTLTVTTTSLPNGTVGTAYQKTLTLSGGQGPYSWFISWGSLPAGITLSTSGVLSGTPTKSGTYYFTLAVADSGVSQQIGYYSVSLTIKNASSPLAVATTSIPSGTVGTAYSIVLNAKNGVQPYRWYLLSGSLPSGITLSTQGLISGTPSQSGSFPFTVQLVDGSTPQQKAQASFTLAVQSSIPALTISTSSLPGGTVSKAYSTTLSASGGLTPYTWKLASGSLPAGISLSSTGAISGTPTTSGSFPITVAVTDGESTPKTVQKSLSLTIQSAISPLSITTSSLSNGTSGTAYSAALAATGGQTPYTWKLASGSLPSGITLSSSGTLSGTPSQSGSFSIAVAVTDSESTPQTVQKSLSLAIQSSTSPLSITTTSLSSGTIGSAYSATMAASGGQSPYQWSVSSGSLPAGMSMSSTGTLTGTPTASGAFNFGVLVTDSSSTKQDATSSFTLQVNSTGGGTTWYIRPDGGTRYSSNKTSGQCNGKADAPYPGNGTNQNCAFNDFRYLYTDGSNKAWVIAGGDTVIVRGGPWRVGQDATGGDFGQNLGDGYLAYNPPIPSGTASRHTRILGENYATCSTSPKTQIFGGWGVYADIYMVGAQYVDVQCFELTDHSQCQNCLYSQDDYAKNGLMTDVTTKNIWLQDLDIHGFTDNGIKGMIGGTVNVNNMRIATNRLSGWEFDDGSGQSSSSAAVVASRLTVEWNGCNEEYPITRNYPANSCADDNSGGYGDGVGTPNTPLNFTCDHCLFRYNTQDGLDLYHVTGSNITITNSVSYGNMGQQFKTGPMQSIIFQNNLAVTNCNRLSRPIGDIATNFNASLVDFCRANGDGIQMALLDGGVLHFENNSIVGYSNVTFDFQCDSNTCSSSQLIFRNNLVRGYADPKYNGGQLPSFYYFSSGLNFTQRDHNLIYNVYKNSTSDCGVYANEVCSDPKLVNEPASMVDETTLDNFNFYLNSGSPAMGAGAAIQGLTVDYTGATRPNPPSIGAIEQ